jgi:TonB-linked SusC/RagA family outer membrane protein
MDIVMKKQIFMQLLLTLLFVSFVSGLSAQKTVITGKVLSSSNKETLIGATIVEQDKDKRIINATITNVDGDFQLTLSRPVTQVTISYIGYKTQEVSVNASIKTKYEFLLDESTLEIQGVEVVAKARSTNTNTMLPVDVRDMAVSIGSLSSKDVSELPVTSVGEMLQGRVSGVDITSVSGNPGAGMSIRIRGTSSLNGTSEPLIVVDGVPYETKVDASINFATATQEEFGAMLDISPSDIETIEVLKDAAASAVWGSRGANGVLLITTKRGSKGRSSFEYDMKLTSNWEPKHIPMLNGDQYSMLQLEAIFNGFGQVSVPQELAYNKSWINYYNYAQNTDWISSITKNAMTHEHNFSLIGGGEKARFRIAMGYLDQGGTTIGTSFKRLTTRMNVDYDLSTKLRFSTDISYTNSDNDRNNGDVRGIAYKKSPNMAIYEFDAAGTSLGKYFSPENSYQGTGDVYYNPVAMANEGLNNLKTDRVLSKFSLRYYFIPDVLIYQGDIAFDFLNNNTRSFIPQSATGAAWTSDKMNRAAKKEEEATTTQTFNKLIFTPKLGKNHRVTLLGLATTYEKSNSYMTSQSSNTAAPSITEPGSDSRKLSLSSGQNSIRNVSFLLNSNYVAFDRYILSASIRSDGDSRFGLDSRWGYFPSVSLAWRLSGEKFMKSLKWVDDIKFRTSYGETGTPPPTTYGFLGKYTAGSSYLDLGSIVPSNIQLDNLKWETVIQKNFGIDYSFFKGKINGNFDLYSKITKDVIFVNTQLPSTSGFTILEARNWGTVTNGGWEFNVSGEVYKNKDWSVVLNLNLAQNQNVIVDIPDGYAKVRYTYDNGQYARRIEEGKPIGSFYGYRYLGVYPTNEDAVVKDKEGNVVVNPITNTNVKMIAKSYYSFSGGDAIYKDMDFNGVIDERDMEYLGDSNPLFSGGFGGNIRYRNFSLTSFFHFKYNFDVVNATRMASENMYNKDNQSMATISRWRKPGDITNVPRALQYNGFNWLGSDRFVEDASYIRLKTLTLSYKLDKAILNRLSVKAVKFYLTAYNLFTWTNYTGQDPEINLPGGDPFAVAIDYSRTPPAKSLTFGANISF